MYTRTIPRAIDTGKGVGGYMNNLFNTLQDFLTHVEGVTYILVVGVLIGIAGFWHFLTQRDGDE